MSNLPRSPDDASRPASALNLIAGIWLIISPWLLGYYGLPVALWGTLLVGIAVVVLAVIRMATTGTVGLSWLNLFLGIWLIISPFVLGFSEAARAMGNAVILGILVGLVGLWAALVGQPGATRPR
jgi:hypothetical protein